MQFFFFFFLSSLTHTRPHSHRIHIMLEYQNRWMTLLIKATYDGSTHPILLIVHFTIYAYLNWNLWVTSIAFNRSTKVNVFVVRVNSDHDDLPLIFLKTLYKLCPSTRCGCHDARLYFRFVVFNSFFILDFVVVIVEKKSKLIHGWWAPYLKKKIQQAIDSTQGIH